VEAQASPPEKMEHRALAAGLVLKKMGFAMKVEDLE